MHTYFSIYHEEKTLASISFFIEGIACTGCALDMENILLAMDGVEEASVNFADSVFSITYDPDEIALKTIINKVKTLGFHTKILSGDG